MKELNPSHKAVLKGRTIFLKTVKAASTVKRVLQPASSNAKLGDGRKEITKGKWAGMPMYQLTLEERATCPKSCQQWKVCYGNNMPFANRIKTTGSLLTTLSSELSGLAEKHPNGFVVRLHVLGDFFSVPYVRFWQKKLKEHSALRLFGYTHRSQTSAIGRAISDLNEDGAWIRWSDLGDFPMAANTDPVRGTSAPGITCPEQTGKTESCMTCGLCWSVKLPIRFMVH